MTAIFIYKFSNINHYSLILSCFFIFRIQYAHTLISFIFDKVINIKNFIKNLIILSATIKKGI